MPIDAKKKPYKPLALEIKSSNFSVPVLVLSTGDLDVIGQELSKKISLAPEFFKKSPVVIDLQELNKLENEADVPALISLIRNSDLLPIGMRGGNTQQNEAALAEFIPVFSIHASSNSVEAPKQKMTAEAPAEPKNSPVATTLVTHPVRSGQRVYSTGDLVILAQVSAGAEIMAEGNIHVYNTLRGRALAGVQGNSQARIFCSDLQAELVSIAGNYKMSDDFGIAHQKKPVQIYLQGQTLVFQELV